MIFTVFNVMKKSVVVLRGGCQKTKSVLIQVVQRSSVWCYQVVVDENQVVFSDFCRGFVWELLLTSCFVCFGFGLPSSVCRRIVRHAQWRLDDRILQSIRSGSMWGDDWHETFDEPRDSRRTNYSESAISDEVSKNFFCHKTSTRVISKNEAMTVQ